MNQGDDDPLDVVELGTREYAIGDVVRVKVLGAMCLLDQKEIDWKVLCINVDEAKQIV